jgi:hypothetical protein
MPFTSLMSYFTDEEIGAVAGTVKVGNEYQHHYPLAVY